MAWYDTPVFMTKGEIFDELGHEYSNNQLNQAFGKVTPCGSYRYNGVSLDLFSLEEVSEVLQNASG